MAHSSTSQAPMSSSSTPLPTVHEHGALHLTRAAARRVGYRVQTPKSVSRTLTSRPISLSASSSDLTKPTIASMSRSRSISSNITGSASKSIPSTLSARRRSILGESKNITGIPSSSSSRSLSSTTSTPHRKVGRVEAGQMTGMGIIRVGPAVQAQRSPKKMLSSGSIAMRHDSGSTTDPYSLAFVPPHLEQLTARQPHGSFGVDENGHQKSAFVFGARSASPEKPLRPIAPMPTLTLSSVEEAHGLLAPNARASPAPLSSASPAKRIGTMSPSKDLAQSPARRRLFSVGEATTPVKALENSPPIVRRDQMDVEGPRVLPSSPQPNAQTPRTLVGPSLVRKHSGDSDDSDDEIDWLSPRKKVRPSSPAIAAATAMPLSFGLPSLPPSPGQIRSPPKKSSSSSESTLTSLSSTPRLASPTPSATSSDHFIPSVVAPTMPKSTPNSVPMVRSPGIRFPPSPYSARTSSAPATPGTSLRAEQSSATSAAPVPLLATPKALPMPSLVLPNFIDLQLIMSPSNGSTLGANLNITTANASTSTASSSKSLPPRSPSSFALSTIASSTRGAPSPAHTRSYLQRKQRQAQAQPQPHSQSYLTTSGISRAAPSPSKPSITLTSASQSLTITEEDVVMSMEAPESSEDQPTEDVSMNDSNTTSIADSSSLSCSSNRSMSEETSKRLANLQNMLSKLSMPRPTTPVDDLRPMLDGPNGQSHGARAPPSNLADLKARRERTKNLTAHFREEYTVPLAGADEDDSALAHRQRSALRASVPPSAKENLVIGMGPPPVPYPKRRVSSAATKGSNGIVDTSSRGGPLAYTNSAPSVLITAPSGSSSTTTKTGRRISGGGPVPASSSTAAIAAAVGEGESNTKSNGTILKGVVAFVDVRTLEGDDAGMIFVDMLKSMGARVMTRPTATLTHIVYKSGRPGTLQHYRTSADPKPHLVGISWVVRCAELNQRVEESSFLVEAGKEDCLTFQKKRKSMEPKALAATGGSGRGGLTVGGSTDPGLKATIAASLERARRKSLQFAPKVGSPLAKRVFVMPVEERNEDDEEPDESL